VSTASAQSRNVTVEVSGGSVTAEVLTGGSVYMNFDLSGEDFRVAGLGEDIGVLNAGSLCSGDPGCTSGTTLDFGAEVTATHFAVGLVTVNGETLEPAYFSGSFRFRAEAVTIPKGKRKRLVLTTPFTFGILDTSVLAAYASAAEREIPGPEGPWASLVLSGRGTAIAYFERLRVKGLGTYYRLRRVVYNFEAP
jgi:hypothetical protein